MPVKLDCGIGRNTGKKEVAADSAASIVADWGGGGGHGLSESVKLISAVRVTLHNLLYILPKVLYILLEVLNIMLSPSAICSLGFSAFSALAR